MTKKKISAPIRMSPVVGRPGEGSYQPPPSQSQQQSQQQQQQQQQQSHYPMHQKDDMSVATTTTNAAEADKYRLMGDGSASPAPVAVGGVGGSGLDSYSIMDGSTLTDLNTSYQTHQREQSSRWTNRSTMEAQQQRDMTSVPSQDNTYYDDQTTLADGSTIDGSTIGGSTYYGGGGSTYGGSTYGGSTYGGGSTMGGTTLGGSTIGGSTYGGASTMGGSTIGASTIGGSTIGASTIGGSTILYPPVGGLGGLLQEEDESDYYHVKQKYGYLSVVLSILQLLILMIMLAMCGVAPMDVNPMIGPYPDALSDWGGKNAYLIIDELKLWRLVTPVFLHAGVIHLFCNLAIQLETGAFFEREWGSARWLAVYLVSSLGGTIMSCVLDPDRISVGSSGALMGLFGAKLSEFLIFALFDTERKRNRHHGEQMRLEQLSGVLCSIAIVSMFSFIPFVDWSGHVGGLLSGCTMGMILFSKPIQSENLRKGWRALGVILTVSGFGTGLYYMFTTLEPVEELADVCEYFRRIFAEGYEC
eukprot:scaffold575820_cov71-Attheya_sp.AAC.1